MVRGSESSGSKPHAVQLARAILHAFDSSFHLLSPPSADTIFRPS